MHAGDKGRPTRDIKGGKEEKMVQIIFTATASSSVFEGVATTAFEIPDWAPDIAAIGTTAEVIQYGSTSLFTGADVGAVINRRYRKVGVRHFSVDGSHGAHTSKWDIIMQYRAVGELIRS